MDKLYRILKLGGVACIFIDSKNDTIKNVQDICEKEIGLNSNSSEDLYNYLEFRKIKYSVFKDKNEISGLIENGEFTKKAKIIISVLSWKDFILIEERTKNSIKEFLNSKKHWTTERHLIIIKKPA